MNRELVYGVVEKFFPEKGFGFAHVEQSDGGSVKVFVHKNDRRHLLEGRVVGRKAWSRGESHDKRLPKEGDKLVANIRPNPGKSTDIAMPWDFA